MYMVYPIDVWCLHRIDQAPMPVACCGRYIVNDRAYPNRPFVLSQFAYTIDNALYRQVVAQTHRFESNNRAVSIA